MKSELHTRQPLLRRLFICMCVALGLLAAPATGMLARTSHAAAEVSPPDCFDDPNMPGCSGVGGGGGDGGGTGTGDAGGGKGGGGSGPAYRTFITDDEVVDLESYAMWVRPYEPSQWESDADYVAAIKAYWDAHSTSAVCVFSAGHCDLAFYPDWLSFGEPGIRVVIWALP